MIRRQLSQEIQVLATEFPVVAILGPRQSGKTTLAKALFQSYRYVSLEDFDMRGFAEEDPRGFLERYDGQCIFDEIQRVPQLMSYLQSHVDLRNAPGDYIITGSHNFFLMEQISQSLAGRVGITRLLPFSLEELRMYEYTPEQFLYKGFYPRIYDQSIRPASFYRSYLETYIEKDVRQLKQITKLGEFRKFLGLLAGRAGQELNLLAVSDECGVSQTTLSDWLTVLEASFLIYRLRPFHKNYHKRLVKRPKIYFYDTGLLCHLLGIRKEEELDTHFLRGSIFENLIIGEFMKQRYNHAEAFDLYFWRDNHKKEIDLIIQAGQLSLAVEIKSGKTFHPRFFGGLRYWEKLTGADPGDMYLLYGGDSSYTREGIHVCSWKDIPETIIARVL